MMRYIYVYAVFFFNDTATTEIYTLSLHDALPIFRTSTTRNPLSIIALASAAEIRLKGSLRSIRSDTTGVTSAPPRSEEHTSELQSRQYLVCRLLLEKKKKSTVPLKHPSQ